VTIEVPVLVAGGGPVGLVTALELQARGVRVLLVERHASTTHHPKMDITNGRSMELFRRLGLAERIRDVAVPRENCMDVSWVTRLNEWELARFRYPNVHEARDRIRSRNDGSQPLEPPMRLSQVVLEPELVRQLGASPRVDLRFGWVLVACTEEEGSVRATIREESSGREEQVRCQLLAGCDGAASVVREQLGFTWDGSLGVGRMFMVHFRSCCRELLQRFGVAWHYQSPVGGSLVAQDDRETWTLHIPLRKSVDASSIEPVQMAHQCLGREFPLEVLQANLWRPHLVSATGYGRGRIWMAGDAVHQYIPTGGYGMNTGIGDAVDLSWKLDAVLRGWGDPRLLDSYTPERRPVAVRNGRESSANLARMLSPGENPALCDDTPEGEATRAELGPRYAKAMSHEWYTLGIHLGYRYDDSPINWPDGTVAPPLEVAKYVQESRPGARAPHVWLSDGRSTLDLFGDGFVLLQFTAEARPDPIVAALRERHVPVRLVDLSGEAAAVEVYAAPLVLVRPDGQVAWRGASMPEPGLLADCVRGAAPYAWKTAGELVAEVES
jgi:2-polyprenyl-6-methoxyphenol hydroxylase-like FAD-dependent oxidoreductase